MRSLPTDLVLKSELIDQWRRLEPCQQPRSWIVFPPREYNASSAEAMPPKLRKRHNRWLITTGIAALEVNVSKANERLTDDQIGE